MAGAEQQETLPKSSSQQTVANGEPESSSSAGYMVALKAGASRLREVGSHVSSQARPWDEIFDRSAYDRPSSLGEASSRVRKNANHFKVNYLMFMAATLGLCMLLHPASLVWLLALLFGWIYVFLLRTEPIIINGRQLSEREKVWAISGITLLVVMITNIGTVLFSAIGLALTGIAIHGSLRVPDDLFLEENENDSFLGFLKPPSHQGAALGNV